MNEVKKNARRRYGAELKQQILAECAVWMRELLK